MLSYLETNSCGIQHNIQFVSHTLLSMHKRIIFVGRITIRSEQTYHDIKKTQLTRVYASRNFWIRLHKPNAIQMRHKCCTSIWYSVVCEFCCGVRPIAIYTESKCHAAKRNNSDLGLQIMRRKSSDLNLWNLNKAIPFLFCHFVFLKLCNWKREILISFTFSVLLIDSKTLEKFNESYR